MPESRRSFAARIAAFGWNGEEFWTAFGSIGAKWAELAAKSEKLQLEAYESAPAKRRELEAAAAALSVPMCAARADALAAARTRFGSGEFDRFLYTVAAPVVTLSAAAPSGDEAARLRYVEGGCR